MQSKVPDGRIPKITPDNNRGSIRIRFRYQGKDYTLTGLGRYDDPLCLTNAEKICQTIKMDILTSIFDCSLHKYRPKAEVPQNVISLPSDGKSLKEVWEAYKTAKATTIAETTQIIDWKQVDRCLSKAYQCLKPENSYKLVAEMLLHYSPGTLYNVCRWLAGASNFAAEKELIPNSYWSDLGSYLPEMTENQRSKQAFTENEIDTIFQAFRLNTFTDKFSAYKDSFFADFVEFLFLTGCRPSEAIALRWEHVKGNKIHIKQAYVGGVKKGTKSKKHNREFPINAQMRAFLDKRCPEMVRNPDALIFPGQKGGFINLHNFSRRYWKRIVDALWKERKVEIYLPLYNLRHTAASFYSRQGVDLTTLAKLLGTSEDMLQEHYLGADRTIQLPEI